MTPWPYKVQEYYDKWKNHHDYMRYTWNAKAREDAMRRIDESIRDECELHNYMAHKRVAHETVMKIVAAQSERLSQLLIATQKFLGLSKFLEWRKAVYMAQRGTKNRT